LVASERVPPTTTSSWTVLYPSRQHLSRPQHSPPRRQLPSEGRLKLVSCPTERFGDDHLANDPTICSLCHVCQAIVRPSPLPSLHARSGMLTGTLRCCAGIHGRGRPCCFSSCRSSYLRSPSTSRHPPRPSSRSRSRRTSSTTVDRSGSASLAPRLRCVDRQTLPSLIWRMTLTCRQTF
jgi:hypothetical protein